jgi:hypothetical protein
MLLVPLDYWKNMYKVRESEDKTALMFVLGSTSHPAILLRVILSALVIGTLVRHNLSSPTVIQ